MTERKHETPEKALWRRAAPAPGPLPDPGLIAAWLEDRLDAPERAAVEGRLAATPDWLEAAVLARAAVDGAAEEAVPEAILARARKLMSRRRRTGWAGRRSVTRWLEGGAAAGVVVAAGLVGFMLGQAAYRDFVRGDDVITAELPAELEQWFSASLDEASLATIQDWEETP